MWQGAHYWRQLHTSQGHSLDSGTDVNDPRMCLAFSLSLLCANNENIEKVIVTIKLQPSSFLKDKVWFILWLGKMVYYASIQRKNKIRISGKGPAHFVWVTWLQLKMNGRSHCHIREKLENQWPSSHLIDATTMRLWKRLSELLRNHPQSQTYSHQTITHKTGRSPVFIKPPSFLGACSMLLFPCISSGKSCAACPSGSFTNHSPRMCLYHHDHLADKLH